jgi:hypothetical protein
MNSGEFATQTNEVFTSVNTKWNSGEFATQTNEMFLQENIK